MPSEPSPRRDALVAFEEVVRGEKDLADDSRARLIWVARQARAETPRAGPFLRELQAGFLRTVLRVEAGGARDLLAACRALDSLTRTARALGLLRTIERTGKFVGGRPHRVPPMRPAEPTADETETAPSLPGRTLPTRTDDVVHEDGGRDGAAGGGV